MSTQDNTEKVLRSLHVMLSKSDTYEYDSTKVIIDRQRMVDLLTELNKCIYAMMDEYELTKESRDQAERAFQKHGDEIVWDASRKAEDIYAASVMYTDEALSSVQDIMAAAADSMKKIYEEMEERLKQERQLVRSNQTELKSQLQDFVDTEKYLKLIEERNREIKKEKARKEDEIVRKKESSIYANRQTEVRVNTEVLERMGLSVDTEEEAGEDIEGYAEVSLQEFTEIPDQEGTDTKKDSKRQKTVQKKGISFAKKDKEPKKEEPLVRVNLDADYFKWKEEHDAEVNDALLKEGQEELSEGIQEVLKNLAGEMQE